ncbi:axin-1-like isoform X1 [Phycodurus eques]|uniref:axin-1-like isoform X1 n=1 Tax=Phycodurus eques TaxID=693459 RepID=UPI002ACED5A0|nr:axin-1-like isoform X1 [Phycodurus eques]XP_061536189.1 axin-1-like isoform X1 [Phycodurus eques]XP_061536190.1 axin-1-like isoform X1 [Phycodurus eques]XP_061536191.1 axin-1-like isoform X1 [Phycodurus eques]XP_061536192.1 axin-1-like isoform X1 [Phycodurus eques]
MSVVRDLHGIGFRGGGGVAAPLSGPAHFTEDAPRPPVPGEEGSDVEMPVKSAATRPGALSQTFGFPLSLTAKIADSSGYAPSSSSSATPRRPDLDLGYEPEGSASPTPPYLKWAESLHSLLDDQEGIQLFRNFLCQESCADLLDFWFACSGFRKTSPEKRVKLAKAIYRKYIMDGGGIVSKQIKPATKSFIRDCVGRPHPDPAMFEQAQTEIQATMEENTYPLFLKSDLYLEYTRTGGESPKLNPNDQSPSSGPAKPMPGCLPTLTEDEEWRCENGQREADQEEEECGDTPAGRLTNSLLMQTVPQRTSTSRRQQDTRECRPWREPVNPYYANMGYARAPATSANDSEQQSMSSDADTLSLTDSSVDGIPPYRYRKQHRKEMHESAKANGRVPLPHIPRTYRIPKDIHVEPERFAAELIRRLEMVLREREAEERLEERLKRVRLEEEGDDADISVTTSMSSHSIPLPLPSSFPPLYGAHYSETTANTATVATYGGLVAMEDSHDDDPESILDEHVQRVMKTPGCQSPGATNLALGGGGRQTPPKSVRSPDGGIGPPHYPAHRAGGHSLPAAGVKGMHHHKQMYHHRGRDGQEEAGSRSQPHFLWNGEAAGQYAARSRNYADGAGASTLDGMGYNSKGSTLSRRGKKPLEISGKGDDGGRGMDTQVPLEDLERNQKILQWMMEGDRQRKSSHGGSTSSFRRVGGSSESPRPTSVERPGAVHPWVSAQLRNNPSSVSPAIVTHPTSATSAQVQPSHPFIQDPAMPPNPAPNPLTQLEEARRRLEEERRRAALQQAKQRHKSGKRQVCENMTVAYYFCGEPIPYRTSVKGRVVTLGQFKELLTKKGHYRFYFKKVSDEFDCGVVFEEVRDDAAILPIFEEKIIGKVEKVD